MRHAEHDHCKGDKGQQRNVVCYQHGAQKAEQHERKTDRAQITRTGAQLMRHPCEHPGAPQPRHDYHQAVKQRQRAEVDIPKICRVRRDKAAAHCCRDKRDA